MKNISKKILLILVLTLCLFGIVSCKKDVTFTINCPSKLYVTQSELLEGYSSEEEKLTINNLTPDLIEILDGKVIGKKAGKAQIEFSNEKGKKEIKYINVLSQPNPTSIEFKVYTNEVVLGVEYSFEVVTKPAYALRDFQFSYDTNVIDIDFEKGKITFKRSGDYSIACYSNANFSVKNIYSTTVKRNSEIENYEILYLGNSLTKYSMYDIPNMVSHLLKEDNVYVYVTTDDIANQWLDTHRENLNELILEREYTHVILQERSFGTLTDYNRFSQTVSEYYELIKQNGAKPVLYETWGYTNGYKSETVDGEPINVTKEEMRDIIFNAYHKKAEEIGATVFCSGEAFEKCEEVYSEINLYSDTNHASLEGGFLSACVHYATLTGRRASDNAYYPKDIDQDVANKLKEIADIIVFKTNK